MKEFKDLVSPLTWVCLVVGTVVMVVVVFRPTLIEFGMWFGADYCGLILINLLDKRLFLKIHPDVSPYFFELKQDEINQYSLEQKLALFESMVHYPARRALHCAVLSVVKAFPGILVIIFVWRHQTSNLAQCLAIYSVGMIMWTYFYGAVFIENHGLISKRISQLHKSGDWSEVFKRVDIPLLKVNFEVRETISLIAVWAFMLSTQWIVISTRSAQVSTPKLALEIAAVGFAGLVLNSRLWFLGRNYFIGGLQTLFSVLESFEPSQVQTTLSLHSSHLLAQFEKTFNALMERLRAYDQELSHWIFLQAEQSRYRALGEISALIVHDLSAPLHVIHFCTEQLKENPALIQDQRYLEQLARSGDRSLELITSLRAYLKNSTSGELSVTFRDAFEQVMRLLETMFYLTDFKKIEFKTDPDVLPLKIKMTKADLIHVLLNLYGNGVENLLTSRTAQPLMEMKLAQNGSAETVISIRDNGTGLSAQRFEELTDFMSLPARKVTRAEGLGLRLVRKLVERNGGTLTVLDPTDGPGTLFQLKLAMVQMNTNNAQTNEIRKNHMDR